MFIHYKLIVLSTFCLIVLINGQPLCSFEKHVQQQCLPDYTLANGVCLPNKIPYNYCPVGYQLVNNQCVLICNQLSVPNTTCGIYHIAYPYPNIQIPPICTTPIIPPKSENDKSTTPPTSLPPVAELTKCSDGWIHILGECKQIKCPPGLTLYNSKCVQIACQNGTVWTGNQCESLLEIKNVIYITQHIYNFLNKSKPRNITINYENFVHLHLNNVNDLNDVESSDASNELQPTYEATTISAPLTNANDSDCCIVRTPRMCKFFDPKWVCFNRRFRTCGTFCTHKTIYLRPPKVAQYSDVIVIPPNLMIENCQFHKCNNDVYDCSGCIKSLPEKCSPYCYRYFCPEPQSSCTFVDQKKYCESNDSHLPGCTLADGCIGDWCKDIESGSLNPNVDQSNAC